MMQKIILVILMKNRRKRGDDSNIAVYGIIALIALAGAAGDVFYGKKKKHH